jgi:hypothetical protein
MRPPDVKLRSERVRTRIAGLVLIGLGLIELTGALLNLLGY